MFSDSTMLSSIGLVQRRFASKMLKVVPVKALEDNYMYLVYDDVKKEAAAVDPVEPEKIVDASKKLGVNITTALVTHHHWDHAGGMKSFKKIYPDASVKVYGGDDRIDCLSDPLKHEDKFEFGGLSVTALSTPCHTKGHICYFIEKDDEKVVMTGDTLFIAGCGRFFEGTADQMQRNLNEVLSSLPDDTKVYPGHEYTAANLNFAKHVEPHNQTISDKLAWALECKKNSQPTVPSTIGEEKKINPFMRVDIKDVQHKMNSTDPVAVMNRLRDAKNNFK